MFRDIKLRKLILPPKEANMERSRPDLQRNPAAQEEQLIDITLFKVRLDCHWKRQPLGPSNDNAAGGAQVSSIAKSQPLSDADVSVLRRNVGPKKEGLAGSKTDHVGIDDRCSESRPQSSKPLAEVEDIDAADGKNLILMSEYVNDIYDYLYKLEEQQPIDLDRFDNQLEVTTKMRAVLVDWINELHFQFNLEIDTFHLTVGIIDRYLQVEKNTTRKDFQLVGVAALFIATKYEELFPPTISDFVYIIDSVYNGPEIKKMEWQILKTIDGNLSRPLPIHFLRRFAKAAKVMHEHYALAKYFLELSSVDHELASCKPSKVAAASLSLSLYLLDGNPNAAMGFFNGKHWTPTLTHYSRYTAADLRATERHIAKLARDAPTATLKSIYTKFQSNHYLKIAQRPELSGLVMDLIADGP